VEIRAWFHPGDDAPVMWSCTECKRKFVPIDLEMEKDAARYRVAKRILPEAMRDPAAFDDAMDLAIKREELFATFYDPIAVWAPEEKM
jgi:hypothetical protein